MLKSLVPAGLLVAASGVATAANDAVGDTVRRAIAAEGPIVTAQEHERISVKCGLPPNARADRNIGFDDGALRCPDGHMIKDAETVAMEQRIAARAKAHVRTALGQPGVRQAIDRFADEQAREALRRIDAR